ncbi:MAG: cyclic nucleotide-binding domain-containing protein [Thermodesulfovibrionales bacterium]|nr:cyclic nucleotide-binding domain-containing protein [Thermodesulfovibrionales bacterium]
MNGVFKELYTSMKGEKSVFKFLSDEDIEHLAAFFKSKNVPAGEPLWKEEDPFDYIAFIVSGKVEIKKEAEFGNMNVIMGMYSRGALCILDDSLRKVTAIALEDVSLAIITQENLDKLIATNPGLGAKLLKGMLLTVSDRLRKSFDRIVTFF